MNRTMTCPHCGHHALYDRQQFATFRYGEWICCTGYGPEVLSRWPLFADAGKLLCRGCGQEN
jgi:hypothetical protein